MKKLHIAIIGAGPAGIYTADLLQKEQKDRQVYVDIFDELPSPYGLVRYGVAPDHPRIKSIIEALREILSAGHVRFFGNVRYGRDLSLEDLKKHYHAVVFATGASRDQQLDLPGINATGSFGAAGFVSWFDAHPDVPLEWPLTAESVAVIGNGNVALDVSRMLVKHPDDLAETEIPDNVLEGLRANKIRELHIFGRRGPGSVRFTPLELRELGEVAGVDIVLNEADFLVEDPYAEEQKKVNKQLIIIGRIFDAWRQKQGTGDAPRKLFMHFWSRPIEVITVDGAVAGFKVMRTAPDGLGGVIDTGETQEFAVQALYRAVGYLSLPLAEVPFDEARGVVKNDRGRVLDSAGKPIPGMFVTGWVKRGPIGLIGHTKSDAMETVTELYDSASNNEGLWSPELNDTAEERIVQLLAEREIPVTTIRGWQQLDEHELALGAAEGRLRKKVQSREDMTRIARSEVN